jgi:hypothetical protein
MKTAAAEFGAPPQERASMPKKRRGFNPSNVPSNVSPICSRVSLSAFNRP